MESPRNTAKRMEFRDAARMTSEQLQSHDPVNGGQPASRLGSVLHNFAIRKKDITDEESTDDNDGREVPQDIDTEYGLDEEGVDKRQAVMLSLPM